MTDSELIAFAAEFRDGVLGGRCPAGMCAAVSMPLASLLQASGVDASCREIFFPKRPRGADGFQCSNHVVVQLWDGRILDATADQFGLDPVVLGPMPPIYIEWGAVPTDMSAAFGG